MTICKITVFALVRELSELQRYDVMPVHDSTDGILLEAVANKSGEYIRTEDFLAVMARNVIPEAP